MSTGLTLGQQLLLKKKKELKVPPPTGRPSVSKAQYVKLVSKEGHAILVPQEVASVSRVIKSYLAGQLAAPPPDVTYDEAEDNVLRFPFVAAPLLEKAMQYCHYKHKYDKSPDERPTFDVEPTMALELLKVATVLQC